MILLPFPLIFWRILPYIVGRAPSANTSLSQNTYHHFWIFPIAILLPVTQSFCGLDGMDKADSLDWFFSVVPPKTNTVWNELEILRHIHQSGGLVRGTNSCRSHLGTLNNFKHVRELSCALSWLYFWSGKFRHYIASFTVPYTLQGYTRDLQVFKKMPPKNQLTLAQL